MFKVFLSALTLVLIGCDKTVTNFVSGARPPNTNAPVSSANEPGSLKVTPGRFKANGPDLAIDATVTPTNRLYNAGDLSVKMTLSRGRSQ